MKLIITNTVRKYFVSAHLDSLYRHLLRMPKLLFYHGIAIEPDSDIEPESISIYEFTKHLKYLVRYYRIISINEFIELYVTHKLRGDEISLTFDDGYKNMLYTAAPILSDFNIPYSLFLTTNNISNGALFPTTINRLVVRASSLKAIELDCIKQKFDLSTTELRTHAQNTISWQLKTQSISVVNQIVAELESKVSKDEMLELRRKYKSIEPLNWNEAKQLANDSLCTIGSHGMDHICCHNKQSIEELKRQFEGSKSTIEEKLEVPCEIFSYPNGNYTEDSNKLLKESGYKYGLSTKRWNVYKGDRYSIPRLYVPYDYNRFVYSLVTYPY